jgi:hypothetical protein
VALKVLGSPSPARKSATAPVSTWLALNCSSKYSVGWGRINLVFSQALLELGSVVKWSPNVLIFNSGSLEVSFGRASLDADLLCDRFQGQSLSIELAGFFFPM